MKIKLFGLFKLGLLIIVSALSGSILSAQETAPISPSEEFEEFGRTIKTNKCGSRTLKTNEKCTESNSSAVVKPNPSGKKNNSANNSGNQPTKVKTSTGAAKPVSSPSSNSTKSKPTVKTVKSVGSPGIKVWAERKRDDLDADFIKISPTINFQSGDWVRFYLRLNFTGYLAIYYRGSSGKTKMLFPPTKILPNTNYPIPDEEGWKFDENSGTEELLFIFSLQSLTEASVKKIANNNNFEADEDFAVEKTDRDLIKPKRENDEIYVLTSELRLKKPVSVLVKLKHF